MNINKICSLICVAIMIVAGPSFAQKNKSDKPLDGLNYEVKITVEAQAKPTKPMAEELSFKNNKLKSKAIADKYSFKSGEYTATIDESNAEEVVTTFDAFMFGETPEDVLTWHGTVTGEDIEGSAIWTKKGKVKKSFAFVGTLKKKK
jgi:hypothetical protein